MFGSGRVGIGMWFLDDGAGMLVIGVEGFRADAMFGRDFQRVAQVDGKLELSVIYDVALVVVEKEPRRTDELLLEQAEFEVDGSGHGVSGTRPQSSLVLHSWTEPPKIDARRDTLADTFRVWRIEVIVRIRDVWQERIARVFLI